MGESPFEKCTAPTLSATPLPVLRQSKARVDEKRHSTTLYLSFRSMRVTVGSMRVTVGKSQSPECAIRKCKAIHKTCRGRLVYCGRGPPSLGSGHVLPALGGFCGARPHAALRQERDADTTGSGALSARSHDEPVCKRVGRRGEVVEIKREPCPKPRWNSPVRPWLNGVILMASTYSNCVLV
jgi:hypothetical protein